MTRNRLITIAGAPPFMGMPGIGEIIIVDLITTPPSAFPPIFVDSDLHDLAITSDQTRAIINGSNNIYVVDLTTGTLEATFPTTLDPFTQLIIPIPIQGDTVATSGDRAIVIGGQAPFGGSFTTGAVVLDVTLGQPVSVLATIPFPGPNGVVHDVAMQQGGGMAVVTEVRGFNNIFGEVRFVDTLTGAFVSSAGAPAPDGHDSVEIDSDFVVLSGHFGTPALGFRGGIDVWDISGPPTLVMSNSDTEGVLSSVHDIDISPNGQVAAAQTDGRMIEIDTTGTGSVLATVLGTGAPYAPWPRPLWGDSIAVGDNGVVAIGESSITHFDPATGASFTLSIAPDTTNDVAITPNGAYAVVSSGTTNIAVGSFGPLYMVNLALPPSAQAIARLGPPLANVNFSPLLLDSIEVTNTRALVGGSGGGDASVSVVSLEPGAAFCFGDGGTQPGCTDCPCGNNVVLGPVGGCVNTFGTSGILTASGFASVAADSLQFLVTGAAPASLCTLTSADNMLPLMGMCPPGSGIQSASQDGLRCIGGNLLRQGSRATDAAGTVVNPFGPPFAPTGGLIAQGAFVAGQTRQFQGTYRDIPNQGCGTGLNTTNAYSVTFLP